MPRRLFKLHRDDKSVCIQDKERKHSPCTVSHIDRTLQTAITTPKIKSCQWEIILSIEICFGKKWLVWDPVIAYNEKGTIQALWESTERKQSYSANSRKQVGKPWSNPVTLNQSEGTTHFDLVLDAKGNAVAALDRVGQNHSSSIQAYRRNVPEQPVILSTPVQDYRQDISNLKLWRERKLGQ